MDEGQFHQSECTLTITQDKIDVYRLSQQET